MYSLRPVFKQSNYKSPLSGLYICGAGTHPGGGINGNSGINAAKQIIDLGAKAVLIKGGGLKKMKGKDYYLDMYGNQNWFLNSDRNINTPVKAIQILAKKFDKIFFVCGSDRSLSYSKFGKYALN